MNAIAIIIFTALVICGVWLLYSSRELIRLGLSSYRWAITEGTIVDSHDDSFTISGIGGTSGSSVDVPVEYKETAHIYEYQVEGRTYRCSNYCFGGWSERLGAAYHIGTKVPVYYDPRHPETAVLRRGIQLGAIFGVVPIGVALFWLLMTLLN